MRRRLIAQQPSELRPHDHVGWCDEGPGALEQVAVSAFTAAAERGERMIFLSERPDPDRLAGLADLGSLLSSGAVQLASVEETYSAAVDLDAQLAHFELALESALSEGYSGICVVADNTAWTRGSDEAFASWLAWEGVADRLQARRQVTGVCYFDRRAVPSDRLGDLAAVHPVLSSGFDRPEFQLFADDEALWLVGELDRTCHARLRRVLGGFASSGAGVLDLSRTEFIDHRTLALLNQVAIETGRVHVRGARAIVRAMWDLLDLPAPAVELC